MKSAPSWIGVKLDGAAPASSPRGQRWPDCSSPAWVARRRSRQPRILRPMTRLVVRESGSLRLSRRVARHGLSQARRRPRSARLPLGGLSSLARPPTTVASCDGPRVRRLLETWVYPPGQAHSRSRRPLLARRSDAVAQQPVARGRPARQRRLLNRRADAAVSRQRSGRWW
jgi:hypothetical protein